MKLHDQVCTIDQAKRLKDLGVKQESLFSWFVATDVDDEPALNRSWKNNCILCGHPHAPYFEEISAFTLSELFQILPLSAKHPTDGTSGDLTLQKDYDHYREQDCYICGYFGKGKWSMGAGGVNAAEAAAGMLIILLENKLDTADEVNKRLTA